MRQGNTSHLRSSKRSLHKCVFKWLRTVRVRIWTPKSPQVLLHGVHWLQLEYWQRWWWCGLIVFPGAITFGLPHSLKHRSNWANVLGQARPPFCGCCCQFVGEMGNGLRSKIEFYYVHVIKTYDNRSVLPSESLATCRCIAGFVFPMGHFAINFPTHSSVADERKGLQAICNTSCNGEKWKNCKFMQNSSTYLHTFARKALQTRNYSGLGIRCMWKFRIHVNLFWNTSDFPAVVYSFCAVV